MKNYKGITLDGITDFRLRFICLGNCYKDNKSKKLFFCPNDLHDFEFKLNLNDCIKSETCTKCWNNYFAILEEREKCI